MTFRVSTQTRRLWNLFALPGRTQPPYEMHRASSREKAPSGMFQSRHGTRCSCSRSCGRYSSSTQPHHHRRRCSNSQSGSECANRFSLNMFCRLCPFSMGPYPPSQQFTDFIDPLHPQDIFFMIEIFQSPVRQVHQMPKRFMGNIQFGQCRFSMLAFVRLYDQLQHPVHLLPNHGRQYKLLVTRELTERDSAVFDHFQSFFIDNQIFRHSVSRGQVKWPGYRPAHRLTDYTQPI